MAAEEEAPAVTFVQTRQDGQLYTHQVTCTRAAKARWETMVLPPATTRKRRIRDAREERAVHISLPQLQAVACAATHPSLGEGEWTESQANPTAETLLALKTPAPMPRPKPGQGISGLCIGTCSLSFLLPTTSREQISSHAQRLGAVQSRVTRT